jgi:protein-disulfide isomerase
VTFEDFHCPYYKRVQSTLTWLLNLYPDKLKLVHRDFPIDCLRPAARKGHNAAR